MNKTLAVAILAGLLASNAVAAHDAVVPTDKEKCYGIAKEGKNDCSSKANKHSCAGNAKKDNDPNEWKFVAKGECTKLKGALTPAA